MNGAARACVAGSLMAAFLGQPVMGAPGDEDLVVGERVLEVIRDRRNPEAAERVAAAIELLRDYLFEDDVAAQVKEWLSEEQEPWVRYYLLRALVERDEEQDYPFILALLHDPDPALRAVAIDFSEEDLTSDIESALVSAYPDEDLWWMRKEIVEALGEGESARSLQLLIDALEDPVREVQAAAVKSLAERADPRSVEALLQALERGTLVGENSPATALGRIGDPSAARALEKAAGSPYPPVRQAAAGALAGVGSKGSGELLMDLLEDPDMGVESVAASALVTLEIRESAGPVLAFLAKHPNQDTFESLVWMKGVDTEAACSRLLASGDLDGENSKRLAEMCATIEERHRDGMRHVGTNCILGGGWSRFWRLSADARQVATVDGARAIGWEHAPTTHNGGVRHRIDVGTMVRVDGAAWYLGETWLRVEEPGDGLELWVREADLQAIDPADALAEEGVD